MCENCGCTNLGKGPEHQKSTHRHIQLKDQQSIDLLAKNNAIAKDNRQHFQIHQQRAFNLISSPGSGKTTLLVETLKQLIHSGKQPQAIVIEGDQQTELDAQRIRETGVKALQVQTGSACHLDAAMVQKALQELPCQNGALVFIENVGNLICPAAFDLGEHAKVVLLSVTEGDDKALKYPHIFHHAKLLVITKIDLLPYVDFDIEACISYARRNNSSLKIITLSAKTGDGLDQWLDWLDCREEKQ